MPLREIRKIGDHVLRKKSKKVDRIDPLILQLLEDMAETMYAEPGIGLAAAQVGVNVRAIVVDVGEGLHKILNPKIVKKEGSEIDAEGCLSVPGKIGDVERATKITVKSMDINGKNTKFEAEGLFARCIQHEIDHLDGILFIDRATNIREPEVPQPFEVCEEIPDKLEEKKKEELSPKMTISDVIDGLPQKTAIFEVSS